MRLTPALAAGCALWLGCAPVALGQNWQQRQRGGDVMAVATDPATRGTLGVVCEARTLSAIASPVPSGASGRVTVVYQFDGETEQTGEWTVNGTRLIADERDTQQILEGLRSADTISLRIADGEKSEFAAAGAGPGVERVVTACSP